MVRTITGSLLQVCGVSKRTKTGFYLHEHDNTLAQNLTDGSFVVIVALEDFFLQEFPCGQMKGLVGPVEPAAVQPLLTC